LGTWTAPPAPTSSPPESNSRYHELRTEFSKKTGLPVLLNTSLNRRGEPMICSPDDALNMVYVGDVQNLGIGDFLVRKSAL
jgi:carbamoyltransferase